MNTIYVTHDTLTPDNVRAVLDGVTVVPPVGTLIRLPHAGYDGAQVTWRVAAHDPWVWVDSNAALLDRSGMDRTGHWSVTIRCTDHDTSPIPSLCI